MDNLKSRVAECYPDLVSIKNVQITYSEINKNNEVDVTFYIPLKTGGCNTAVSTFEKKQDSQRKEYWYMKRDWND